MTKQDLESIVNNLNSTQIKTPMRPLAGFTAKSYKAKPTTYGCKDWGNPGADIEKNAFGNPIAKSSVLAAIDSQNNGTDTPNLILDVVIAIGINYGQVGTSQTFVSPYDDTKMRPRLVRVYKALNHNLLPDIEENRDLVLVATNFFPWLTVNPWNGNKTNPPVTKNSIEEMLFIYCCGCGNPFFPFVKLVDDLNEKQVAPHIVFHGTNNAVPLMGRIAIEKVSATSKLRSVVFCDNLAHGNGISNAVLWS